VVSSPLGSILGRSFENALLKNVIEWKMMLWSRKKIIEKTQLIFFACDANRLETVSAP
jgi:hypothetical protein